MLKDIRQQVQAMVNNGENLEQISNSGIAANYDSLYSDNFINSEDFLGCI
jgi:hypothetical protein